MEGGMYGDDERLRLLIVRVGDMGQDKVNSNLSKLLTVVCSKEHSYKEIITELIISSIEALPDKCSIYATFLALLNSHSHSFLVDICQSIVKRLYSHIEKCDFIETTSLLRMIAYSVKCNFLKSQALTELVHNMLTAYTHAHSKDICLVPLVYAFPIIMIALTTTLEDYNTIKKETSVCMDAYKSIHGENFVTKYWDYMQHNDCSKTPETLFFHSFLELPELSEPSKTPVQLEIKTLDTPESLMSKPLTYTLPQLINCEPMQYDPITIEFIISLFLSYKGAVQPLSIKLGRIAAMGHGQLVIKVKE